jgi:DNA mismatch repair protein MutL
VAPRHKKHAQHCINLTHFMSKIRILSDALASQVAAGEVVERPAAVLRELVDNALDAGATQIEVAVLRGGSALIRVTDNGCGMDREDALLCLERHATSKIRTSEDLGCIRTFGFRGEALPSIASVSRFRLVTQEKEALSGTEIEIHGGKLMDVKDSGGSAGTMAEARSLFFNVPARRKFLRTEQTEYSHVEQQFTLHAIAHPQVAFTLIKDGQPVYHLPATQDIQQRIAGLVGEELAARLLPVLPQQRMGIEIHGYIGGAGFSRSNRQMQIVYLNGRAVENAAISNGLREGYHTALMKGQYPVCFLYLRMEPEAYDVNVHPAKKEVRFHDSFSVRAAITQAVQDALQQKQQSLPQGHVASMRSSAASALPVTSEPPAQRRAVPPLIRADSTVQPELAIPKEQQTQLRRDWSAQLLPTERMAVNATSEATPLEKNSPDATPKPTPTAAPSTGSEAPAQSNSPANYRIIGVLNKLYVLLEGDEGLVLMDQHAAHERILFEKVRAAMEKQGVPSQRLLISLMLKLTPRDYDLIQRHLDTLQRLGIEAEAFGNNTLKVDALPNFMQSDDPVPLLNHLIEELGTITAKSSALRLGEDMIATTACRAAIKANDFMHEPELKQLLRDLMACEQPHCCPHGRPTLIQISYPELERKFGRRAPV